MWLKRALAHTRWEPDFGISVGSRVLYFCLMIHEFHDLTKESHWRPTKTRKSNEVFASNSQNSGVAWYLETIWMIQRVKHFDQCHLLRVCVRWRRMLSMKWRVQTLLFLQFNGDLTIQVMWREQFMIIVSFEDHAVRLLCGMIVGSSGKRYQINICDGGCSARTDSGWTARLRTVHSSDAAEKCAFICIALVTSGGCMDGAWLARG